MLTIYTDGSCLRNPGVGGWAACIIQQDGKEYNISGNDQQTTNNRMELMAVIEAVKYIKDDECILYSDSQLIINCAQKLWKRNKNLDMWSIYDDASKNKKIRFEYVKAHNGDKYNEKVDKIAKQEAKKLL